MLFLFNRILLLLNKNRSAENPASRILSCLLIQNLSSYSRKEPCRDPSLTIPAQALLYNSVIMISGNIFHGPSSDAFVRFDCCSRRSYRLIPFINVYISQIRIIGPAKRIRSAKIPPITVITVTMKKTTITRRSSFQYHLFRLK